MSLNRKTNEDAYEKAAESGNAEEAPQFRDEIDADDVGDASDNGAARVEITEEERQRNYQVGMMPEGSSSSKRKATASESHLPAKRATGVHVPETFLTSLASSIKAATLDLMALPSTDVAARGRLVANMAEWERGLKRFLGIEQRGAPILAVSEHIVDAFMFLPRSELDSLQLASRRFNAIIEEHMKLQCLRLLKSAKVWYYKAQKQFMICIDELGAKNVTRLPTGTDDVATATTLLPYACQSSRLDILQLDGTTPINLDFLDALAQCAPSVFLKRLCWGNRSLSVNVPHDKVLRALQAFAELQTTDTAGKDSHLELALIRTCFKAGVDFSACYGGKIFDAALLESSLIEFSFSTCQDRFANRERSLRVTTKSLKSGSLQRWIQNAEVGNEVSHKLTLHVTEYEALPLDTAGLDAYQYNGENDGKLRFRSVTGRQWEVTCGTNRNDDRITEFQIN